MRVAGRHTSTYVLRFVFSGVVIGFFALTLLLTWADSGSGARGTVADLQSFQKVAPQLGTTVLWTQYVGLMLLTPIMCGSAICGERRSRTLAALLTTPLTAWEILLSKLTGRLTQVLILAAISLPLLLAARMLGGLSLEGIVAAGCITLVSVFLMAALTIGKSIRAKTPAAASAGGFTLFIAISFLPPLVIALYNFWFLRYYTGFGLSPISLEWMYASSLPITLGMVTFEHFAGSPTGLGSMDLWGRSVIVGVVIACLTMLLGAVSMRRAMQRDPEGDPASLTKPKRKRKMNRAAADADDHEESAVVQLARTRRSRLVGDMPVLWRETRQPIFKSKAMIITSVIAAGVLTWLLLINGGFGEPATYYVLSVLAIAGTLFQSCFLTTGSISNEREARTLDVLLSTPLTPTAIILGKYAGAVRKLMLGPVALMLLFACGAVGYVHPIMLILVPLILVPPILMFSATGMVLGIYMRSVPAAMCNVGFAISIYMIVPLVIAMSQELMGFDLGVAEFIISCLVAINPLATTVVAIEGAGNFYGGQMQMDSTPFSLPYGSVSSIEYVFILLVSGAVQVLVAALGLMCARSALPIRSGRSG
jgi:ABC-type transport system involved in multi-copper enzyme maturation permease subunit